jgi:hypothetical protein
MTIVSGHKVIASPCCQTSYRIPQYSSINLSAFGYWTDGEKESGLYPVGNGLRKCQCGAYYLLRDAVSVDFLDASGVPNAQWVGPADLTEAIRTASSAMVELAARHDYWRHLNDEYRTKYRAHRDVEEAEADARWLYEWRATLTPWQRLIQRIKKTQPPALPASFNRPFTIPPYTPTTEQLDNMKRLLTLILAGALDDAWIDWLEVAELYREQGLFHEAQDALGRYIDDHSSVTAKVLAEQIAKRVSAPIRYRM